jgi:prophage antirepressor-like protein
VFVESHILTGIPEAERLAEWVIEEGVNKAVRRKTLQVAQMYREVNATLDWGIKSIYKLQTYLERIGREMPKETDSAEEYLLQVVREGYLLRSHSIYLYETYVNE